MDLVKIVNGIKCFADPFAAAFGSHTHTQHNAVTRARTLLLQSLLSQPSDATTPVLNGKSSTAQAGELARLTMAMALLESSLASFDAQAPHSTKLAMGSKPSCSKSCGDKVAQNPAGRLVRSIQDSLSMCNLLLATIPAQTSCVEAAAGDDAAGATTVGTQVCSSSPVLKSSTGGVHSIDRNPLFIMQCSPLSRSHRKIASRREDGCRDHPSSL